MFHYHLFRCEIIIVEQSKKVNYVFRTRVEKFVTRYGKTVLRKKNYLISHVRCCASIGSYKSSAYSNKVNYT